jgi:hypothetical protein
MAEGYTVTEDDLVHYWACHMDWRYEDAASEARRGIARIKAEAWDRGMRAGLDNGLHLCEAIHQMRAWPDGPPQNPHEQDGETA